MARYIVGSGLDTPATEHYRLHTVVKRVNWLVMLGYQRILIRDKTGGWQCYADSTVTEKQLIKALHAEDVTITSVLDSKAPTKSYKLSKRTN